MSKDVEEIDVSVVVQYWIVPIAVVIVLVGSCNELDDVSVIIVAQHSAGCSSG